MTGHEFLRLNAVYLAGPIEDVSNEDGTLWRESVSRRLNDLGFVSLSPTDKMAGDNINALSEIGEEKKRLNELKREHKWDAFMQKMAPIISYDLRCVDRCSAVIAYIGSSETKMSGTLHELIVAKREKKKIYIVIDFDPAELNSWFIGIMKIRNIYNSFDSAIGQLVKDFS